MYKYFDMLYNEYRLKIQISSQEEETKNEEINEKQLKRNTRIKKNA
jgi:hypothetical protein